MKILLADDDKELVDVTTYALRKHGFTVIGVTDGRQALKRWGEEQPSLVLLDVTMPGLNGFEVCQKIREESSTPVIMLTGRTEEEHVVQGFTAGADDYVTKPFSHKQLALRIRAVVARSAGADVVHHSSEVRTARMVLDTDAHEVAMDGKVVRLTPLEFRILFLLASNEGHVVTTNRLIEYAWAYDGGDPPTLKTHICHVRQKLGLRKDEPNYILSVPHVGYTLTRA
jgi:DNA-binding response OmpR family regulator